MSKASPNVVRTYNSNELKSTASTHVSRERDVKLIRAHLARTERELRAKDTSHFSPELQARREHNLDRLREYWQNGEFPINTDFPDERVPYFVDDRGVPCAMAYLIQESGHKDLVQQVAAENNHVYIEELEDGPVIEWIEQSGLTLEEAARIQPTYCRGLTARTGGLLNPLEDCFGPPTYYPVR